MSISKAMNKELTFISTSPEQTDSIAAEFCRKLSAGTVIALHGDLGSGKTRFVQGMAHEIDIKQPVTSPTFTVINEYKGSLPLYHIDLYRLNHPDEVLAIGFEDYLESDGITAIEWPDRAGDLIPDNTIHIYMKTLDAEDEREIRISGHQA